METITDPAAIRASDEPDERGDFPCCTTPAPSSGAGLDLDAGGRFATNAMAQARAAGVLVEHSGAGVSGGTVMRGDAEITRLRRVLVEEITRAESAEAEVVTLRAKVAAGLKHLGGMIESVEGECQPYGGMCHGYDTTDDDECALIADLSSICAALATTGEGQ